MTAIAVDPSVLIAISPFSLIFDCATGRIVEVGTTTEKVAPGQVGRMLDEAIELSRPSDRPATAEVLLDVSGMRMKLVLRHEVCGRRSDGPSPLHGIVHPLGARRGLLILSFGARVAHAVRRHDLDASDFGPMNPTVELLFALEARNGVQREAQHLQARLDDAVRSAEALAQTDTLTGLANRRALDRYLAEVLESRGRAFGVMHLDLDHFKDVNDTLGHAAGDAVLSQVATVLLEEVRREDLVARVGGDEFVIIFRSCDDVEGLISIGERIVRRLEEPIPFGGDICRISGSVGVTLSSRYEAPDPADLLADADRALYEAKRAGRARVSVAA